MRKIFGFWKIVLKICFLGGSVVMVTCLSFCFFFLYFIGFVARFVERFVLDVFCWRDSKEVEN